MRNPDISEIKEELLEKIEGQLVSAELNLAESKEAKEILYQVSIYMDTAYQVGKFDQCMSDKQQLLETVLSKRTQ